MKLRHVNLLLAAIVALAPAVSNASPEKAALDACARAFASSLASPGSEAPAYKVSYRGDQSADSMFDFYTREYSFDLHVNDPKTGLPIARASCSADSRGTVVALRHNSGTQL